MLRDNSNKNLEIEFKTKLKFKEYNFIKVID